VIRDAAEADIPIFFEYQRDPESMDMAKMPARDEEAFTAHWQKILADDETTKKTILFDGEVAGNVLIFERGGKRLVGYWIGREFWGKGLATRALAELLAEETTRPLHAYVATSNPGSMRVLEKCGFTLVGRETEFDERLGEEIEEALYILET
jgi:RimJ/RimL family protein N-acetyltransferase